MDSFIVIFETLIFYLIKFIRINVYIFFSVVIIHLVNWIVLSLVRNRVASWKQRQDMAV